MGGWGTFLDRVSSWLPIQKRVERWKNQIEALEQERSALIIGKCDDKKANRVVAIDRELIKLRGLLKNHTQD